MTHRKKFKLIQLTDLHLKNYPFDEKDLMTLKLIQEIVRKEEPDLLIFTGDIVWGSIIEAPLISFQKFVDFCNSLNVPVTFTYGNHDVVSGEKSRKAFREVECDLNNQAMKKHVFITDDRENYVIEVSVTKKEVDYLVVVMDSGGYQKSLVSKYDYLLKEQIDWFDDILIKYPRIKEIVVFQHIPVMEFKEAYDNNQPENYTKDVQVDGPKLNTGFFSRLVESVATIKLSVGHNHENNFQTNYLGVEMMFGQLTGFSPVSDIERGARVFCFDENNCLSYLIKNTRLT